MTENAIEFTEQHDQPLPMIQIHDGQVARNVDETQEKLIAAGKPIFVRGGMLVTPIWTEYPASKNRKVRVTTLKIMDMGKLRYMLNKGVITYLRFNAKQQRLVAIDPPDKVLQTLLAVGHWKFPRVAGVSNAPTLRPDGSIAKVKGYDAATQLWLEWDDDLRLPEIPEQPTMDDAQAAKNLLIGLLEGFPFIKNVDRAVALAALLTAVLRGSMDIAPMFLFVAHVSGTGKSYLTDLISTIINGRACPVITAGKNEEEAEKRLGSLLLESPSIISLDNLSKDLEGDLLCQMCSQRTIKTRVLGRSETPDCEWRGTLLATGNNVKLVGDMLRRGLICHMDANMERPETRAFDFDPIEDVMRDRGRYIAAAMTLVKAYMADANKVRCTPFSGFDSWSDMVRKPLIWVGMEDPIKSTEEARKEDPQRVAARQLIEMFKKYFPERNVSANELMVAANETDPTSFEQIRFAKEDLHTLLTENASGSRGQIEPRSLGRWLSRVNGQVYDGYCVVKQIESPVYGHKYRLKNSGG